MEEIKIFYCWQNEVKNGLKSNIKKALKKLKKKYNIEFWEYPAGDKSGSPDITNEIFDKIKKCDIFIADLSTVHSKGWWYEKKRFYRNNNVLVELGFANACLDKENIIIFADNIDDAPFDLRNLRMSRLELSQEQISQIIECAIENKQKNKIINEFRNLCKICLNKKLNSELKAIRCGNETYSIICGDCKDSINLELSDFSTNAKLFPRGDWDDEYDARVNIQKLIMFLNNDSELKKYFDEEDFSFMKRMDKEMGETEKNNITLNDFIEKIAYDDNFKNEHEVIMTKLIKSYNDFIISKEFNFEIFKAFDRNLVSINNIMEFLIVSFIPKMIENCDEQRTELIEFIYNVILTLGKKLFVLKDNIIMLNFIDNVFNELLCPYFNYGTHKLNGGVYNVLFKLMSYCFLLSNEYGKINILNSLFHLKYKCKNKIIVDDKEFNFDLVIEQVISQGIMLNKKQDTFEIEKIYEEKLNGSTIYF